MPQITSGFVAHCYDDPNVEGEQKNNPFEQSDTRSPLSGNNSSQNVTPNGFNDLSHKTKLVTGRNRSSHVTFLDPNSPEFPNKKGIEPKAVQELGMEPKAGKELGPKGPGSGGSSSIPNVTGDDLSKPHQPAPETEPRKHLMSHDEAIAAYSRKSPEGEVEPDDGPPWEGGL